ncbi:MAG: hypothetical protein WCL32_09445, partial [Planctomycetota bacterium]
MYGGEITTPNLFSINADISSGVASPNSAAARRYASILVIGTVPFNCNLTGRSAVWVTNFNSFEADHSPRFSPEYDTPQNIHQLENSNGQEEVARRR